MPGSISWQKSSFSGGGDGTECIEIAAVTGAIQLREGDDPDRAITTSPEKLRAFILGVKAGEFDHFTA
jgi:hypothetical protein